MHERDKGTKRRPADATVRAAMRSLSQTQAAALIGRPRSFLTNHPALGGRNDDGSYDGPKLVAAFVEHVTGADGGDLRKRKLLAECRQVEAAAMKLEQQVQREANDVISVADVETVVSAILSAYTERFSMIGQDLAPMFGEDVARSVVPMVEGYIDRLLIGLREELQRRVLAPTDPEASE